MGLGRTGGIFALADLEELGRLLVDWFECLNAVGIVVFLEGLRTVVHRYHAPS